MRIIKRKIPVDKHVKKFLVYYFKEPYVYSKTDFIAPAIAVLFKKGYRTRVMKECEESFEIHFRRDHYSRFGSLLEWGKVLEFNKAVNQIFRAQLFSHMDINRKLSIELAKRSMVQFLKEMEIIEDDINYETLYRDYGRKQKYSKTIIEKAIK